MKSRCTRKLNSVTFNMGISFGFVLAAACAPAAHSAVSDAGPSAADGASNGGDGGDGASSRETGPVGDGAVGVNACGPGRAPAAPTRPRCAAGKGGLAVPVETTFQGGVRSSAAADLDGDGNVDLVVSVLQHVKVFWGKGDGTFSEPTVVANGLTGGVGAVATADFNGDGLPDLASLDDATRDDAQVWLNTGSRSFGDPPNQKPNAAIELSPGVRDDNASLLGVDLDGNGQADLVSAGSGSDGDVAMTQCGKSWSVSKFPETLADRFDAARGLAVGDMNGDRIPDIVYQTDAIGCESKTIVRLGNGDGTFKPAAAGGTVNSDGELIVLGDVNKDGKLDAVTLNEGACSGSSSGRLGVLLGNGNGLGAENFTLPNVSGGAESDTFITLALADVDNDGNLDAVSAIRDEHGDASLYVLPGKGDGTFSMGTPRGLSFSLLKTLSTADFNGDGLLDIVVAGDANNGSKFVVFLSKCLP